VRADEHRRLIAIVAVVTLIVGAGIGFAARGASVESATPERAIPSTTDADGPTRWEAGVPVGFAHTEAGALAAARTMSNQINTLFAMNDIDRAAAMRRYAAEARAEVLVARLDELAASFGKIAAIAPDPEVVSAVVRGAVDTYDDQRARVTLYLCQILVSDAMQVPMLTFLTGRYELVWEDDDWRVWSVLDTPGPTPLVSPDADPTDTANFRAALPAASS